jgi:hypothetical protein
LFLSCLAVLLVQSFFSRLKVVSQFLWSHSKVVS